MTGTNATQKINLQYKPVSVNEVWQGKRFKTIKYKQYERDLLFMLPNTVFVGMQKLSIEIIYGFSNSGSDVDNCCKPLLDILQKKYRFNDNQIYRLVQEKIIVKKGQEFIKIKIDNYLQNIK